MFPAKTVAADGLLVIAGLLIFKVALLEVTALLHGAADVTITWYFVPSVADAAFTEIEAVVAPVPV